MTEVRQDRRIGPSPYDTIAELYDPWSRSVTEDVGFYVAEARKANGPVVELGVGTGRIAIPIAWAGIPVVGVDSSREMLAACARTAKTAAVSELLDLRLGDFLNPPVDEPVSLVICPFRTYLHLADDAERVEASRRSERRSFPAGGSSSTSSSPRTTTSRTRMAGGSNASRASTSAPTGTRRRARSHSRSAARKARRR